MKAGSSHEKRGRHSSDATHDIRVDPEFEALIPPLSKEEIGLLEASLQVEGCRDPLITWKGKNILLDGHNRLRLCREHQIPFKTIDMELPDWETAQAYILKNQLGRRNLTPEAASYLRGKRYLTEKQSHGGQRTQEKPSDQNEHLKTAERLALELKVSQATIRRDAAFAAAVDRIVDNCGEDSRQLLLSRDTGLSKGGIARLGRLSAKDQQKFLQQLKATGKIPRRQRKRGKRSTIILPSEPKSLAEVLYQRLGLEQATEVARALSQLLEQPTEAGSRRK